jgi:hypothetical protein
MTQEIQRIPDVSSMPISAEPSSALVAISGQREVAEVQAAIFLARQFPRDPAKARDQILISCQRPGLAQGAMYTYARGGTNITGPSIRLAEAIAQIWGNMQVGVRELEQREGVSTMEAFAWDMETNTKQTKTFQVKHTRYTKKGSYNLEDPRDIYERVANDGARRLRACILGLIPGDIVEDAVEECKKTLTVKFEATPARIKAMAEAFAQFGVTKEQIEKRIQRKLDAIEPAQMVNLHNIHNSLKDGMSGVADWFEVEGTEEPQKAGNEGLKDKLKGQKAETKEEENARIKAAFGDDAVPPAEPQA